MTSLIFTNAFFEEELLASCPISLLEWLEKHPTYLQLSYLSCLVAEPNETALLPYPPEATFLQKLQSIGLSPSWTFLDSLIPNNSLLQSWGVSPALTKWAKEKNCLYTIPSFASAVESNSKLFSFLHAPKLEGAVLLETEKDLVQWWSSFQTNSYQGKVLKTLQGSAGRGHFLSLGQDNDSAKALAFYKKQGSLPLIGEPWVERLLDFSTQWIIEKNGTISYLGSTLCENSHRGLYRGSITGPDELLFLDKSEFLQEHLFQAKQILSKVSKLGFFGHLGLDAMIYQSPIKNGLSLQPIVEINARKTMGWIALEIRKRLREEGKLKIGLAKGKEGFLPRKLHRESKPLVSFPLQLTIEKIN